ncbi:fibroblast growth factor-binding protein 1 [Polymixia lowei]
MALLTNVTVLLVLACISHQFMVTSCQREKGRKGRAVDKGKPRDRGQKDAPSPDKNTDRPKVPIKGKFSSKDKSRCTWVATGTRDFVLGVTCKKGGESFSCEYVAKPDACPQFAANAKLYWKQIERALKKQKRLCQVGTAAVKAGLCRKAPADAHFKLNSAPRTGPSSSPRSAGMKSCPVDNTRLAEEYCTDTWLSFCTFFFKMVQNDDC